MAAVVVVVVVNVCSAPNLSKNVHLYCVLDSLSFVCAELVVVSCLFSFLLCFRYRFFSICFHLLLFCFMLFCWLPQVLHSYVLYLHHAVACDAVC